MGRKKKKMKMIMMMQTSSSSSLPETRGKNNTSNTSTSSSIGCMSGIFHFISRHHPSHSRKRLPSSNSAGRKSKNACSPPPPQPPLPLPLPEKNTASSTFPTYNSNSSTNPTDTQKQHEIRRSPTLPSEIRRIQPKPSTSSSVDPTAVDSPRRSTPLVVRLMGLHEIPKTSPGSSARSTGPDTAAEKRRKILGALDKCDEDLKALKKIIDTVRVADASKNTVQDLGGNSCDSSRETLKSGSSTSTEEQPSPVSVLDFVSSPTFRPTTTSENEEQKGSILAVQSKASEPSRVYCISEYDDKNKLDTKESYPSIILHQIPTQRFLTTKQKEDKILDGWVIRARETGPQQCRWKWRRSRMLVESVGEVWREGIWEERREVERVGVVVERGILGDLVQEFVRELLSSGTCCFRVLIMSQGNCRKRLCF